VRQKKEFARCYHSEERVAWVQSQPCMWCKYRGRIRMCGPSENAHVKTDGMGRKAGYEFIVPLGRFHHMKYDSHLPPFDTISARMVMEWFARDTEAKWQERQSQLEKAG
jgi:hypothetical protein